jgi:glucose/arabinose dehydrogenase
MVFDPQGRLFYTEKTGAVRLFAAGKLQPEPVITFRVNSDFDRGLSGITLDPDFDANHFIYVTYTCDETGEDCPDPQNRVVRFVERGGIGSGPTTLFTSPQWTNIHAIGNIRFGPDGKLYVSLGDNGFLLHSQSLTTKPGKIHRLNPDGSPPTGNPKFKWSGALPTLYAIGLRHSFDFSFDPLTPANSQGFYRIFASENGPLCDDEMNRIEAGYNYGWRPDYPCDDADPDPYFNSIPPLWYSPEAACCEAPTGIEVYTGEQIPQWRNHIFMATYNKGNLYHFVLNPDRTLVTSARVVRGVKAQMDLHTGPDGALYYIEGGGYTGGALRRIVGSGSSTPLPRQVQIATAVPTLTSAVPGSRTRTFPETGIAVRGAFLDYWEQHGALAQYGFPISPIISETSTLDGQPYPVQYFERAVFEYHAENEPPYNVLLSHLGTFRYNEKYGPQNGHPGGAPNQMPNNSEKSQLFRETGKRLGGRFLEHWQTHGGLTQNGYPISDEFEERSDLDGKTYLVQYFERAVFEHHPENPPPFDVLLSQLGTFQYRQKYQSK